MIRFREPPTILMGGATQAGMLFFFKQILEHQLIQPSASRVISVYGENAADLGDHEPLYPMIVSLS